MIARPFTRAELPVPPKPASITTRYMPLLATIHDLEEQAQIILWRGLRRQGDRDAYDAIRARLRILWHQRREELATLRSERSVEAADLRRWRRAA